MSKLQVDNIVNKADNGAPTLSRGAIVTGVITATSFSGSGANLTGIDATALKDGGGTIRVQANTDGAVVTGILTAPTVSGTTGSFTGNVSVGGTLTYDDVTNIDSVGIITANSGIQVSGIVTAKAGAAVTYFGDGSNLSGIDAAPSLTAVADGSIDNGKPVVLQNNGTVKAISKTVSSTTPLKGVETVAKDNGTTYTDVCYDSTNMKFFMNFRDGGASGKGMGIVGSMDVNDGSITFGEGVHYTVNNTYNQKNCYAKTSDKVVVAFQNASNSNYLFVVVGEINGTSVAFGTQQQVPGNSAVGNWDFDIVYDESADRCALFYADQSNNEKLTCTVLQLTGNVVTFGSATVVDTNDCEAISVAYDSANQRVVCLYEDDSDSSYPHVFVGTIDPSNNSISGNEDRLVAQNMSDSGTSLVYDASAGKFVATFRSSSGGTNSYGLSKVFTVDPSSNTFTAGSSLVTFNDNSSTYFSGAYDPSTQKSIIICRNSSGNIQTKVGTVSGSGTGATITFANALDLGPAFYINAAYVAHAQRLVIAFVDSGNSDYASACSYSTVQSTTNLSQENFIGFSDAAYTNGQTAKIQLVGGIDDAQTGLTTARKYYVQPDGTIDTNKYNDPPIYAGISKSSTEIIIKG